MPVDLALPSVKTLVECADYSKTFEPFLPQLYSLGTDLYARIQDTEALKHLYMSTNPAISGLAFAIATFPIFLVVSEINKNYSQVDRVWSIFPTLFNIHYALWARLNGLPTTRLDNVLAFSVLWSIRLTFNYWRKGGYEIGSEDYRWELIKKYIGQPAFFLLNVVFIASIQPILLWAVTLPTYVLLLTSRIKPEMGGSDLIFSRLLIAMVVFEYFADGQMWNFQQAKKEYQKTAKVPAGWTRAQMDRGFVTTGLWKYSRHPNFAAEQSIWILLYLWGSFESYKYWNWTVAGTIAYSLVFQGSTPITEWISGGKYPEYQVYQQRVGMFVPKLFGNRWNEQEMERLGSQAKKEKEKKRG
ncbi:hypothetical protein M409DRAFT_30602 [Zasmidium cellare ATCC 36951]|uniref:Steroid 5-alpha reductase C-terminal domain-containing protein n=1 Tax=Zasmidium cellare ATCC 36951 TaxID=1080233 RepID=A0A6A6BZN0_ZASCE|nr:uncharacterized protein M409DRAFT_30602 [Zasmidium cellare ATCC 36951]KAF2158896.1 hypothetical protein M409DRAFT_30602 [Zasmidium cellare ATCC 36951]